jgi:HEAT repeat protein
MTNLWKECCVLMERRTGVSGLHVLVLQAVLSLILLLGQNIYANEDPITFEQLIVELEHPDIDRCWDAINALGASGDKRAVPPLMTALEKDMRQRKGFAMAIIPALGKLKDERAVPLLVKALNNLDEDWLGREAAARALGDIGAPKAVHSLIRAAWLPETRNAAIESLATIGDPRAVDVLLSAFSESEEPKVMEAAIAGLVLIGEPAVPALIEKLKIRHKEYSENHERAQAAEILGKIGGRSAVNTLTRALDDPNAEVRKNAATALEHLMQ